MATVCTYTVTVVKRLLFLNIFETHHSIVLITAYKVGLGVKNDNIAKCVISTLQLLFQSPTPLDFWLWKI